MQRGSPAAAAETEFSNRVTPTATVPHQGSFQRIRGPIALLLLGVGYVVVGKAGLLLAVGNASVSVVWPATGVAIAALILGGSELWPAIFAGALIVNFTTTWDFPSSLGIATGNTLEALVGSYLANRFASGRNLLDQPRSLLTFALLSGFGAAALAATVGTTTLTVAHLSPTTAFLPNWRDWWLGDAIGAIEVTPFLLAVTRRDPPSLPTASRPGTLEILALAALTLGLGLLVFGRTPSATLGGYPLVFLVLPPAVWAAFRFGPLGAVLSVSFVSLLAIGATILGTGPFSSLKPGDALLALRIFIASVALTALLVAADVSRHRRLENELNDTRKGLQRLLSERTFQLGAERSLAKVASWTYRFDTKKLVWSEEMYRILGHGDTRFSVTVERALEQVRPEDRAGFVRDLRAARDSSLPLHHTLAERRYHLELPNGEYRTVLSRLQVTGVEANRVTEITGTVQDITEREQLELEIRRLRGAEEAPPAGAPDFLLWMIPWMSRRR